MVKKLVWTVLLPIILWPAWSAAAQESSADVTLRGGNIMSCETYSIRDYIKNGKITLLTAPALYKKLGIRGMALNDMFFTSWENHYLDQVKAAVRENDRVITALIMGARLAGPDETVRKQNIDEVRKKLRAAHYLGAPVVRIDLGGTGRGEAADETEGVERVIAAFKELLPLAKEWKIKMTIENHGGVSKKADSILKIIKGTDPQWVGTCLDFGNWPDAVRYESIEKLAPYAYHTHAKSYRFDESGEETRIDYKRVFEMLRAVQYKGPISIEFEGPEDQVEGVKKTRDLIKKHW